MIRENKYQVNLRVQPWKLTLAFAAIVALPFIVVTVIHYDSQYQAAQQVINDK